MTLKPRPRTGPFLASFAACAMLAGCDSTATIFVTSAQFQQLQFASAWPAKKLADGSWERMCRTGNADGLILNAVLQSSQRRDESSSGDLDLSIRPLDVIQTRVVDGGTPSDVNLSNPGNLSLNLGCINQASSNGECTGARASALLDRVRYAANTADRSVGHNVMVLVDLSASNNGLVHNLTYKEAREVSNWPPNFQQVASDPNSLRLFVASRLIRALNPRDMPGVLAFGEHNGISVPCSQAVNDVQRDLATCFGARNREIWYNTVNELNRATGGRSNLWLAVKTAYDFLQSKNDRQRSNHIVVLTDGPDTCGGEAATDCESPCTTADFGALSAQIEADHKDPNKPKVNIHFVQFESLGYPGRDPRQVEISCVSGGHYQFINSNQFPKVQTQVFQEALDRAVTTIRYALMGHWEIASSVPAYASNAGGGAGVPAGNLYALEGQLVIKREANLTQTGTDMTFTFGYGVEPNDHVSNIPGWDRRPTVRKPCGGFADCGASSAPGSCGVVCSPETLTCANGSNAGELPNLALCSPSQGGSGFCCDGDCLTSGTCASCN